MKELADVAKNYGQPRRSEILYEVQQAAESARDLGDRLAAMEAKAQLHQDAAAQDRAQASALESGGAEIQARGRTVEAELQELEARLEAERAKARELRQLQALIDEAQAEAEALKDAIKAAMGDQDSIQAGEYRITWKAVTSSRIDTTALRKALPDVAERFTKETTTRRFCVA